jgi:hypothetical protein
MHPPNRFHIFLLPTILVCKNVFFFFLTPSCETMTKLDNKSHWVITKGNKSRRKSPTVPTTKRTYRSSLASHRFLPSYNQLVAKFQRRSTADEDHYIIEYEEIDDDVFEEEEMNSSPSTTTTTSHAVAVSHNSSNMCVLFSRHLFTFVSLRKIWDLISRYIWTWSSTTSRSLTATSSVKVVELLDESQLSSDSESEGEDLFQDCYPDENNVNSDNVTMESSDNFCFSPPAPSFIEALNRPLSSLLLRYDVIFTPTQTPTPRPFTPATIKSNSSTQSTASNRARQADLFWDNYDLKMLPQSPLVENGRRWTSLSHHQQQHGNRIPMASCLKTLWSLDSPSFAVDQPLTIAEDVEEEEGNGIDPVHSLPVATEAHCFSFAPIVESTKTDAGLPIYNEKSLQVSHNY